jgi:CheY-like chemotaxis protein
MPLKSGIECLKIIRQNEKLKDLPIIILSTSRAARDIDTCYNLKANYYIVKPFSYIDLSKIISKIFLDDWRSKLVDLPKNQFVYNSNR